MSKYSEEVTAAVSAVVTKQPFFAVLLFDLMKIIEDDNIPTAATDGRNIWVGKWFRGLPIQQRIFVLCHEVLHAIFRHLPRAKLYRDRGFGPDLKPWNDKKFNVAADYYINYMLNRDNIGQMPPVGLLNHDICDSDDVTVDSIYMKLPDDMGEEAGGEGDLDEHREPGEGDGQPSEAAVNQAVTAARNAAKARGNMPGNLERAVGELLEPKQPWKELLADYVTSSVGKDDTSWARPNRRRLVMPPHVPFPGNEGFAMGTMVVSVDTSGSISQDELTAFVSEMKGIIEQVRPRELWACWWDTNAKLVRIEDVEDLVSERAYGGGGTDYNCVAPAIEDEMIDPEIVVCMTDGYVYWPGDFPWQHITVSTSDQECPFGRTVKMELGTDVV